MKFPSSVKSKHTLNIVFFSGDFKIFWTLTFLCFPSVSVCGQTSASAELAEFRKNTKFQGKNTKFNEHPVYGDWLL